MIVKEKLANISMCYCITLMIYNDREYCICASENREGEIVMIDTETKAVSKITGLAGGVMAVIPVPEENGGFLAIQKFYPVFDSRKAEVIYGKISGEMTEVMEAQVTTVTKLPYVHRIALTGKQGERRMIAASLCENKDYIEDWSRPGAVYEYILDKDMQVKERRTLVTGITKNHGMFTYEKQGGSYILVSGESGVWAIDTKGTVQKFFDEPISDLCLYDVDGDGMDEIVCIAPFHGNTMQIWKMTKKGWECIAEEPVTFGHAIWSGKCGNGSLLLSCSRGGRKNTTIYRPSEGDGGFALEIMDIDEGGGASNICVKEAGEAVELYAANHETGEVARYIIEL